MIVSQERSQVDEKDQPTGKNICIREALAGVGRSVGTNEQRKKIASPRVREFLALSSFQTEKLM
jgi:hypothetical protein